MMRTAIYARVSTTNHGQDASLQTSEMQQFVEARGWQLADQYVDQGVSGAKDSRPELNRLMADAKRRRFDVVLVWKLDRFGRSLRRPLARALRIPALTRSRINSRSNSAIAPMMLNMSRPLAVLRSKLSLRDTNAMPSDSNSASAFTRWG